MYLGDPDLGVIVAGYFGSFFMAGAFLAIGCCVSATTSNQIVSFVVSTAICLVMILLGFDPVIDLFYSLLPDALAQQLINLSFPFHFESIQRGVIDLSDFVFFASIIVFSLLTGVIVIDRKKAD